MKSGGNVRAIMETLRRSVFPASFQDRRRRFGNPEGVGNQAGRFGRSDMIVRSIVFAAAIVASTAASAQQATIRYRPYELTSSEGRHTIADRVKLAVRNACRNEPWMSTVRKCRGELSSQLLSKIGNADVAAAYNGQPVQVASRD
ncbi:UrcA family protein [Sphingomonas tabacisoli]|uniref:UrcA family protein n=1 Tax=Sphingomonas tabacisoli TaxID=2249466 RepID=A0ABW4I625_9SPHN